MKKTFIFIITFVTSALLLSTGPVLSSSEKVRQTSTATVRLTKTQEPAVGQLIDSPRQDPELSRRLRKYDLIRMDPGATAAQVRASGKLSLRTSKNNFDVELTPNDLRVPNYSAQVIDADGVTRKLPRTPVNTFRGTVKGSERAQARMTITESGIEGAIITGTNHYFLQPARALSSSAKNDEFVFYEASDLTDESGSCGVTLAEQVAAREAMASESSKTKVAELNSPVTPLAPMKLVRLATDADAEYVAALGGATQANNQIVSIMNIVDGIYQFEIGLTFQVVFQNTWSDAATDPYTSTAPSTLLAEFRNHWNANFTQPQHSRSTAHLWTGKDLDGGTIGVAHTSVACRSPQFSYGLSQRFPVNPANPITTQTVALTAHEIGHNFSADHTNELDTEVPPDIEIPCESSIMEASIGDGGAFCTFSRSQIIGHANAFSSCLTDAATSPPPFPSCIETSLDASGLTAAGSLASSDCRSTSRGVNFFADQFSFNGVAGQRVSITMVHSTPGLDPYLYLIGPDGYLVSQDDDGNGNLDPRIPGSGTIALPLTGKYVLEATSFDPQETGNYTVTVTSSGCTLSVNPTSQHFGSAGGNGTINVTVTGSCVESYQIVDTAEWLTPQINNGTGSQAVNFTVTANTSTAGRRAFLVVGPSQIGTDFRGGISIPITQSGTGPDCSVTPISIGQTFNGSLTTGDCESPTRDGPGFRADRYTFNAAAGQQVAISVSSSSFDTFLSLLGPNAVVRLTDDDSGGGIETNSRIPGGPGLLTLPLAGTYTIEVSSFSTGETGPYTLTLTGNTVASTVQLSQPSFTIVESQTSMSVTVTRTGETSGTAAVDYATSDAAGAATCAQVTGQASSRCDYITTLGRLTFAAGETSKTILIPIVDDAHPEGGSENFTITLSNPSGATLGTQATATLTITDSDTATTTNPIDNTGFFVRQHYIDFLNREPDAPGFAFWTNQITSCGADAQCIEVRRINVSASFFLSIEFQDTGYLVYRVYKSAFGNLTSPAGAPVPVTFTNFLRDTQTMGKGVQVGAPGWEAVLEANKQAFALAFVQRSDFQAAYPNSLTAAQFVDQMNVNAGGALSATERNNLIAVMTVASDMTQRAAVLRAVAEDQTLKTAEFNKAFVLMQYFGYLRRNPFDAPEATLDFAGFNFWLNKLNAFNGNFINAEMVKAFITSIEYRKRFNQ